MSDVYVIDTSALIAFLADEEGADKVELLLSAASRYEKKVYIHRLNILEIYYLTLREEDEKKAHLMHEFVSKLPAEILEYIDEQLIEEAGRIKARYNVSLADSVVLATASQKHAQLVSADRGSFEDVSKAGKIQFYWIR